MIKEDINLSINSEKSPLEVQLIELLSDGPLTRDEIVKKTGIPRTTIFDSLKKLMVRKEVKGYPIYRQNRSRGRPKVAFALFED